MRICMVTHYCKPHIGGIETISFEEAKRLAQQGHYVTLLSSRTAGEPAEECLEGVRIRRVRAFNLLEQRLGVPYPFFGLALVRQLIEEIAKADVCIVHGFAFQSSLAAAWVCNRKRIPYVLIQHNTFVRYKNPLLNLIQRLNDLLVGRYTLHYARHLFAVSEQTREYVHSLVNREIEVLYDAVDHLRFSPNGYHREVRPLPSLPTNKFIVLTVRRLVFKNSVDTFVATAYLLRDDPRVHFVIVGDGPDRRWIERYLQANNLGNCSLTGFVSDIDLPEYYRAANLFVLPSRTGEGLGMVVLEAMASRVPVVATRGGGQVELVEEGRNGFLVDPCAPNQIADIVKSNLDKIEALEAMGQQGLTTIRNQFLLDKHMAKLLNAIEKAACQSKVA